MTQNEVTFETLKQEAKRRHHKIKFAMCEQIEKTFERFGKQTALDELKRLQADVAKRPPTPDTHERMESINALKKIIKSQP